MRLCQFCFLAKSVKNKANIVPHYKGCQVNKGILMIYFLNISKPDFCKSFQKLGYDFVTTLASAI